MVDNNQICIFVASKVQQLLRTVILLQMMVGLLLKVVLRPPTTGLLHLTPTETAEAMEEVEVIVANLKKLRNPRKPQKPQRSPLSPLHVLMLTWGVAIVAIHPMDSLPTLFGKEKYKDASPSSFPMNVLEKSYRLYLVPIAMLGMY